MSDSLFANENLIFLLLHIVGSFVMLSLPLTLYRNPPTKINPFYGFRTAAAKRNQDTWTVANNYFNTNRFVANTFVFFVALALWFASKPNYMGYRFGDVVFFDTKSSPPNF